MSPVDLFIFLFILHFLSPISRAAHIAEDDARLKADYRSKLSGNLFTICRGGCRDAVTHLKRSDVSSCVSPGRANGGFIVVKLSFNNPHKQLVTSKEARCFCVPNLP
jgi:hypothetical protein